MIGRKWDYVNKLEGDLAKVMEELVFQPATDFDLVITAEEDNLRIQDLSSGGGELTIPVELVPRLAVWLKGLYGPVVSAPEDPDGSR